MFALPALKSAVIITTFVTVMMLVVEYLNVHTRGVWLRFLGHSRAAQYILAAFLGATPGCMGVYVIVALYSHRMITLGALVAAMIATSGGEALVMLALFPKTALLMTIGMMFLGIVTAWVTDRLWNPADLALKTSCEELTIHNDEDCVCFSKEAFLRQWKAVSLHRALISLVLATLAVLITLGELGPSAWNWMRITLLLTDLLALFVIVTVPDHFLQKHLWDHIVKKHVPNVFFWTFGVLLLINFIDQWIEIGDFISDNRWIVLLLAVFIGIVPESGPHLLFVTLFAKGDLPFSILLANSIVQDGHGMLPLIAVSRRTFFHVKGINIAVGLIVGILAFQFGF